MNAPGIFFAALMSLFAAWMAFLRCSAEREARGEEQGARGQKYRPYISGALLPGVMGALCLLGLAVLGPRAAAQRMLSLCFEIALTMSVYDLLLLACLPLLRRRISARACAMLWMLPSVLYIMGQGFLAPSSPRLVLCVPEVWMWALLAVWLTGFALVFGGGLTAHLRFRRRLLRHAVSVTEPETLRLWRAVLEEARFPRQDLRLVRSPDTGTPLTVGLFRRTTAMVLPQRAYTQAELRLVFRHEAVHIGREDAWSKFFLLFCTALCWFDPLMWVAKRKSADDLELSCDEAVLYGAGDAERLQYAELLLTTAGDERGFTTCLSASARALRYRLKNIVRPGRRRSGALAVGLAFFVLLCMTSGGVALAFPEQGGAGALLASTEGSLQSVRLDGEFLESGKTRAGQAALRAYLSKLALYELPGGYDLSDSAREAVCLFDLPKGEWRAAVLYDSAVKLVCADPGAQMRAQMYYVPGGLDWALLDAVFSGGV